MADAAFGDARKSVNPWPPSKRSKSLKMRAKFIRPFCRMPPAHNKLVSQKTHSSMNNE